jgi:hypothetical protein
VPNVAGDQRRRGPAGRVQDGPRDRALDHARDKRPEAWRGAAPGHLEYRQFVEHWTTPEFADYVTALEKAADDALRDSDEQEQEQAETAFLEVARLERHFWEMAWSEGTR